MIEPRTPARRPSLLLPAIAGLAVGVAAACSAGSGGSSPAFDVVRTDVSVAGSTPVAFGGRNLAFLADEATTGAGGTDMNGDADEIDSIAIAVNVSTRTETNLAVAAQDVAWIGDELYLQVDEAADGRDWEPADTGDRLVLLHWSDATDTLAFVDRLSTDGSRKILAVGSLLFYASARNPTNPGESNLVAIESTDPLTPIPVATQDTAGPLSPRILSKDQFLVFLGLDETDEGRDLNGDGDSTDAVVLALLDGTDSANVVRSTELAVPAGGPVRARRTSGSSHDWEVAFLVSEAAQGGTNLNDPSLFSGTWEPPQCNGFEDADATDDVLHYLSFAAWDADPIADPPENTGLVGSRKIAIANGYVATITPENDATDAGAEGLCDLNGDGDKNDYVVRWVEMETPILPLTTAANIHALADVPGGGHGLAELDNRFVIVISEEEDDLDLNGDAQKIFDLVAWLAPSGSASSNTPWDVTHGSTGQSFVGASWMQEVADRSRLGVGLQEEVEGVNINAHVPPVGGEDLDTNDTVPTFADIAGSPVRLNFPGVAIAVQPDNAGIVIARNFAFYRVDEADDSRNWNGPGDGDETDFILFRTSLVQGTSASMGSLNSIPGRSAVDVNAEESSPVGGAFLADEQQQGTSGTDLNGDGDADDLVLSYFRF